MLNEQVSAHSEPKPKGAIMNDAISKELLREVLGYKVEYVEECEHRDNIIGIWNNINSTPIKELNIYELAHKNLKQWAKLKNIFDIIDWSEEPEQIFKKVEKIRNEIN